MLACASEEQLAGYVLGTCGAQESQSIALHLERCASCRRWVEEARSDDGLLHSVRRVLGDESGGVGDGGPPTRSSAAPDWAEIGRPAAAPLIDGYQILRELGRGGMGVVYLALQETTKRKVALKVLLEGPFASPAARRRFEREVELAAPLDHPHIVTVLESGSAAGRPYFAMRYVEGRRLDEAMSDVGSRMSDSAPRGCSDIRHPKSDIGAALRLFVKVCEAASYAHRRGVIHRDLKPSNIIVDDSGNPHILDFGLAKPAEASSSADETVTHLSITGQVMGTLAYMSPEQSIGAHRDIDVRSDVYSLGVIFYQMLTGRFPYPVTGRVAETLQHIAHTEPQRPSSVNRGINDEIETIVLMALAKDPKRRYQSADALAGDLGRYLAGQPIEAKRDSGWYVARKLLLRYRAAVAIGLAFVALLGIGSYLVLSRQARLNRALVREVLAAFVEDPNTAVQRSSGLNSGVRAQLAAAIGDYAASSAYTERVAAARSGPWVNPDSFWRSVDGGALWKHGEWLELCEVEWKDQPALIAQLLQKTLSESIRERYVAFSLLGQFAALGEAGSRTAPAVGEAIPTVTREATPAELDPGVIAAWRWATASSGRQLPPAKGTTLFADQLSGITFAAVPGTVSYWRGSPPEDLDRYDDEDAPDRGVLIAPFCMAMTEVTYQAFAPFLRASGQRGDLPENAKLWFAAVEALPAEERDSVAVGHVSLNLARRFCEWLNAQAKERQAPQRYRLPSEEEWEYACGGGNGGRFCYGDDAKYTRYFAACDGEPVEFHRVGLRMPNAFGLHDMHGGLWERTESRYPPELLSDAKQAAQELWVYKGGAFHSPAVRCRRAQRNFAAANTANDYTGFRVVMEPAP